MGTPSRGEKPIVVSIESPSRTAVTEQPPPRWQTTRRRCPSEGPRIAEARSAHHCTERPWKPYRLIPHSSRQIRGIAYVVASAGIVAWKAVSKTATCGTFGNARVASSMPARAGALCSGAMDFELVRCPRAPPSRSASARRDPARRGRLDDRRRRPRTREHPRTTRLSRLARSRRRDEASGSWSRR